MALNVQVYLKNSSFSEDYAQEKHKGEDSPENIRYEWEDEFRINGAVDKIEVTRDQAYTLSGESGENETFSHIIEECMIFLVHQGSGITPLVFSEKCVDEYILDTEKNHLTLILNDDEVIENPIPGIYIVLSHFPKSLR